MKRDSFMDMKLMSDDLILADQVYWDGSCIVVRPYYDAQNSMAYQVDFAKGIFREAEITTDQPVSNFGGWKRLAE